MFILIWWVLFLFAFGLNPLLLSSHMQYNGDISIRVYIYLNRRTLIFKITQIKVFKGASDSVLSPPWETLKLFAKLTFRFLSMVSEAYVYLLKEWQFRRKCRGRNNASYPITFCAHVRSQSTVQTVDLKLLYV